MSIPQMHVCTYALTHMLIHMPTCILSHTSAHKLTHILKCAHSACTHTYPHNTHVLTHAPTHIYRGSPIPTRVHTVFIHTHTHATLTRAHTHTLSSNPQAQGQPCPTQAHCPLQAVGHEVHLCPAPAPASCDLGRQMIWDLVHFHHDCGPWTNNETASAPKLTKQE